MTFNILGHKDSSRAILLFCSDISLVSKVAIKATMRPAGFHRKRGARKRDWCDRILGSARIPGAERGVYRVVFFFILSCLIFKSNVDRGIPSLAAAPLGPATFPLLSAKAASM